MNENQENGKKYFIVTDNRIAEISKTSDFDMGSFVKQMLDDANIDEFLINLSGQSKSGITLFSKAEAGRYSNLTNRSAEPNNVIFEKENGKYIVKFGNGKEPMSALQYFVEEQKTDGNRVFDLLTLSDEQLKTFYTLYKKEKGENYTEEDFKKEVSVGKMLVKLDENAEMTDNQKPQQEQDKNNLIQEVPYQRIESRQLIAYIDSDEYEFPFSSKVLEDTQLITAFKDDLMKRDLATLQAMLDKLKKKNDLLRMKIRAENGDKQAAEQVAKMETANELAQEMRFNAQSGAYEQDNGSTSVNVNNEVYNNKTYHTKGQTGTINNIHLHTKEAAQAFIEGTPNMNALFTDDNGESMVSIRKEQNSTNNNVVEQQNNPKVHKTNVPYIRKPK